MIATLTELARFVVLVFEGSAGGSPLPAVMLAGVLVSAALIFAVMLCATISSTTRRSGIARIGADAEVLLRVRQSNPNAAGHSRSRAPGRRGWTAP